MRLTIDLRMINQSGIGTYLKNIVPELLGGFSQVYALGDPDELKAFAWSKKVSIIPFTAPLYSIKEQLGYRRVIPETDVFWSPHFNAPLLPIKAKVRVATIHDAFHLSQVAHLPLAHKLYAALLFKNAARRSRHVFTVSGFSKQEIVKHTGIKPNKITVVYCGVNAEFFKKKGPQPPLILPDNYILFVGNVKPHKNLITLLRAYANLPENQREHYKIVIIGQKEGFITADNAIGNFIEEHNLTGKVIFTGYIKDAFVPSVYQKASIFVFPSLYEGFGLPVLEALAAGLPVLCSNAASLPEVGGNAVAYFDPTDSATLTQKLLDAIQNPQLLPKPHNTEAEKQLATFTWQQCIINHREQFEHINEKYFT